MRGAFWSYIGSVNINPMHTQAIYDAGGALYDMLASHNDAEAEREFELVVDKFQLRRTDSKRFYHHVKMWSDRLLVGILEASRSKAHRLAFRGGGLLGEWISHFQAHDMSVIRNENVEWALDLDYDDLSAALVCGRTCVSKPEAE